jgi:hypothetical protein
MKGFQCLLAMWALLASFTTLQSAAAQTPEAANPPNNEVLIEGAAPKYVAPNTLDRIGRIWAPVKINGKGPFRLVLDTSANSSAVIGSVAQQLGVQPSEQLQLIGVTGKALVPMIKADSLEVGEIVLPGAKLPVVEDVFGGAEGVLSPKGMTDKRILVDFRRDLIQITRSSGRRAESGFTVLPIVIDGRQLLTFDIRVGGVKTKAVLSTGGQRTVGNYALRDALLKREREGKEATIIGVTQDVAYGQSISVPPIAMGDLSLRNVAITFADTFIFEQWKMKEPALLVGMDVIGSLDVLVIDYKMKELHMRARH